MIPSEDTSLVSIIIATYNYERFIAAAIQSALDVRWPYKEIIVIDDGSTDDSWSIIQSFVSATVKSIHQENAGQVSAVERGFELSTGDIIIFLDADDLLAPDLLEQAVPMLRSGVSKVQVRLKVIDEDGNPTGDMYPKFPAGITPAKIRTWATRTGAYPTPPGSGNVYARWFVDQLIPVKLPKDRAFDSYCLSLAPHLGNVETIDSPLVSYRVHSNNLVSMNQLKEDQFATQLIRAEWRADYANMRCAEIGVEGPPKDVALSIPTLMIRASSLRLRPDLHPLKDDSRTKIIQAFIAARRLDHYYTPKLSAAMFAWTIAILLAPKPISRLLVSWRYAPMTRPPILRRLVPT